jgi:hypothetical protein
MWQHNYEPIAGSLGVSAIVAALPIVVLFVMLGVLRKPAWMSAMTALVSAFVIALTAYGMPAQLAVTSAIFGAAFGMFPIAWIVFSSIMLYRLAVDTGKFETIKGTIGGLTDDRRLQALFIATELSKNLPFCIGRGLSETEIFALSKFWSYSSCRYTSVTYPTKLPKKTSPPSSPNTELLSEYIYLPTEKPVAPAASVL